MSLAEFDPNTRISHSDEGVIIDPSSYVDPNGFLFHYNGQLFRAIHASVKSFYQNLFDNGTIPYLVDQCGLVPSSPTHVEVQSLKEKLIIHHKKIEPVSFCTEWCPEMLRDAARLTVNLSLELLKKDLMLQDAYPWNIVFNGTQPIFVDLTSIVPSDEHFIWPAYSQYQAFFQRPLALSLMKKDKIARLYLYDNINGISIDDFYRHASFLYQLGHPQLVFTYYFDRLLQNNQKLKLRMHKLASKSITVSKDIKYRFLTRLLKQLDRNSMNPQGDVWQNYYQDIPNDVNKKAKIEIIEQLLRRIAPKTVTDLGCNTGVFSLIAAKQKARVIAIDSSTSCINTLYLNAQAEQLPIYPIVSDVICTTPPFGIMGQQYPGLIDRAKSELVLCLGLMHHLHINGRQPFDKIASHLATFSHKHLIFEYVDAKDDNIKLLTVKNKYDYDLSMVMDALKTRFSSIELFDSDRPSRKLLLCTK